AIALTAGRAVRVLPFRGFRKAITEPTSRIGTREGADGPIRNPRWFDSRTTSTPHSPRQPHWRNELLNIKKKALGIGMSAGLIASLFATAFVPAALAAITIGSAGNVPVGGTSATTATFTFTEQAINSIPTNTAGSFTVTIAPSSGLATNVSFVGTPSTALSTGSLGATASIAGNVLTVNIAGSDTANIESVIVTG